MGLVTSQYLAASGHMDAVNRGCRPYMFSMQGIIVVSKIVHLTNGLLMAEDGQGRHLASGRRMQTYAFNDVFWFSQTFCLKLIMVITRARTAFPDVHMF